jgi:hypothetical protein
LKDEDKIELNNKILIASNKLKELENFLSEEKSKLKVNIPEEHFTVIQKITSKIEFLEK